MGNRKSRKIIGLMLLYSDNNLKLRDSRRSLVFFRIHIELIPLRQYQVSWYIGSDISFTNIFLKLIGSAKFWHRIHVFSIVSMWSNFHVNPFSHVRVIALLWHTFAIFYVTTNNFSTETTRKNLMKIDMIVLSGMVAFTKICCVSIQVTDSGSSEPLVIYVNWETMVYSFWKILQTVKVRYFSHFSKLNKKHTQPFLIVLLYNYRLL